MEPLEDVDTADLEGDQIEAYAEHTLRALNHVMTTFGLLELHDRVAIVVSDERFAAAFRAPLADELLAQFPSRPVVCAVQPQRTAASWRSAFVYWLRCACSLHALWGCHAAGVQDVAPHHQNAS